MHDQIGGMNKSSKNILETIRPPQVLVGVELVAVRSFKGYTSHRKLSLRSVPHLGFKAAIQARTTEKIIPGSSDEF